MKITNCKSIFKWLNNNVYFHFIDQHITYKNSFLPPWELKIFTENITRAFEFLKPFLKIYLTKNTLNY